ncbi:O-methyltransferase [Nocardiopsis salina]|uniref:O-methyltransferase n=1 Tax=Nocardiopsis salina TaxID=245836 RepID=UPI00036CE2CF|nr:class I SAM-dependent methyltransferase [Nocardiopsis salina]
MSAADAKRLTIAEADRAVTALVDRLAGAGLLPAGSEFDAGAFHTLRSRVWDAFHVPQTSISPVMARLMFAIGDCTRARRVLVVGSYYGNTLVWLAGRALLEGGADRLVGADVDPDACAGAEQNFARLGGRAPVCIESCDGRDVLPSDEWDLLLLDADCPHTRKAIYLPLLHAALPHMAPAATVLAHDTALPAFAEQLAGYKHAVGDRDVFAGSAHLAVDPCGLELSRVGRPTTTTPRS